MLLSFKPSTAKALHSALRAPFAQPCFRSATQQPAFAASCILPAPSPHCVCFDLAAACLCWTAFTAPAGFKAPVFSVSFYNSFSDTWRVRGLAPFAFSVSVRIRVTIRSGCSHCRASFSSFMLRKSKSRSLILRMCGRPISASMTC